MGYTLLSIYSPAAVSREPLHREHDAGHPRRIGPSSAEIRISRGLTQAELGIKVGASQRVIAYYESHKAQPPGAMLVDLAKALKVSADELLGLTSVKEKTSPKQARLLKRLQQVEKLPPAD